MTDNNEQRQAALARSSTTITADAPLKVTSPHVRYTADTIESTYRYSSVSVTTSLGEVSAAPRETVYKFRTTRSTRRTGLLQVGWGGNNGVTLTAGLVAHRHGLVWTSREGEHRAHLHGSLTQASTMRVGFDADGRDVFVPLRQVVPLAEADNIVLGGWDISGANMADAMDRCNVLEPDLKRQLRPHLKELVPLPAAFDADFIAINQHARADNLLPPGSKWDAVQALRKHIREFKRDNDLGFVAVVWTANSERYSEQLPGVNDTADNLIAAIKASHKEVSPSTLYCVAAVLEGCAYVNGSPQNTFVPGMLQLAAQHGAVLVGDDFKSGQTKMKSVLVDYLVGCGVKVRTMVTYNHLGNNDMYQLTDQVMWKPKSASKSRVIEDIVDSNGLLYTGGDDKPDHVVVVKYVPFLGDSKRDVSEYTSETWLDSRYTSIMHNECLDSALCAPLILDLAILTELFSRVQYTTMHADAAGREKEGEYELMEGIMSVLGFYMKIPRTPAGEPIVNALGRQKACIENILRALVGLPPENNMLLETKCPPSHSQ